MIISKMNEHKVKENKWKKDKKFISGIKICV